MPKTIRSLGPDDTLVRFEPSSDARRKCPGLPRELVYRLIRYQFPGFHPSWLLTSLTDPQRFTRGELIDLYHRRWSIETIYREWKHTLDLQNLRSHTPNGIFKEVYAHVLLSNLTRWVMTEATERTPLTPVTLSYLTSLSLVKIAMIQMFYSSEEGLLPLYSHLLAQVRLARIRQRPGRSYPRRSDRSIKNRGHGKRQTPARLRLIKRLA